MIVNDWSFCHVAACCLSGRLDSPEGSKNILRIWMVTCFPAYMSEQDSSLCINYKRTAKLPGIALYAYLSESFSKGPHCVSCGPQVYSVKDPALQTSGTVCCHGGVHEQRERDVPVFLEGFGMLWPAIADNYKFSTKGADGVYHVAQLRDLLTAEQSPKVPYEDENNRPVLPEMAKHYRTAAWVKNLYRRQFGCNIHGSLPGCVFSNRSMTEPSRPVVL